VPGPTWLQRLVGVAAVVLLTAANYRGIAKTAVVTRTLVALTMIVLVGLVVAVLGTGSSDAGNLAGWWSADGHGVYGVLQAAGLLFFAFAGYARIATLGEEVREPERTIPRAIPIALGIVFVLYLAVGVTGLLAAGADRLAESTAPLATAVESVGLEGLAPVVRVGAALASLGTLIVLIAGVGRTTLAMARNADLPGWLAAVHPRFSVPHHAELAVAVVVCVLVLSTDLRGVIGFSSFGVLTYYAVANASAFTQPASDRRWPRTLNVLGVLGCAVLAFTLPIGSVVAGLVVLTVGVLGRLMVRRRR
jgi:APA family basic amino acid/polyamine antiporter